MQKKRKTRPSPDIHPIYKAFQHMGTGATDEAVKSLLTVTKKNLVEYIDAQMLLGKLYSQTNKIAEAEPCFKQVPLDHPEYIEIQIELAHLYLIDGRKRYQEAIDCYITVIINILENLTKAFNNILLSIAILSCNDSRKAVELTLGNKCKIILLDCRIIIGEDINPYDHIIVSFFG